MAIESLVSCWLGRVGRAGFDLLRRRIQLAA